MNVYFEIEPYALIKHHMKDLFNIAEYVLYESIVSIGLISNSRSKIHDLAHFRLLLTEVLNACLRRSWSDMGASGTADSGLHSCGGGRSSVDASDFIVNEDIFGKTNLNEGRQSMLFLSR